MDKAIDSICQPLEDFLKVTRAVPELNRQGRALALEISKMIGDTNLAVVLIALSSLLVLYIRHMDDPTIVSLEDGGNGGRPQ